MTAEQRHYDVIIAPLITEKATAASEEISRVAVGEAAGELLTATR